MEPEKEVIKKQGGEVNPRLHPAVLCQSWKYQQELMLSLREGQTHKLIDTDKNKHRNVDVCEHLGSYT